MTLGDFTEDTTRAPILHKDDEFTVRVPGKGKIYPGYRGPIPARRMYGFVQFCTRAEHYHQNEGGYALSERVLRKIRTFGCQLVLFAEEDTNHVYEFHERQFTDRVAAHNNPNHEDDPQRVVRLDERRGAFENHADTVLMGERGVN